MKIYNCFGRYLGAPVSLLHLLSFLYPSFSLLVRYSTYPLIYLLFLDRYFVEHNNNGTQECLQRRAASIRSVSPAAEGGVAPLARRRSTGRWRCRQGRSQAGGSSSCRRKGKKKNAAFFDYCTHRKNTLFVVTFFAAVRAPGNEGILDCARHPCRSTGN